MCSPDPSRRSEVVPQGPIRAPRVEISPLVYPSRRVDREWTGRGAGRVPSSTSAPWNRLGTQSGCSRGPPLWEWKDKVVTPPLRVSPVCQSTSPSRCRSARTLRCGTSLRPLRPCLVRRTPTRPGGDGGSFVGVYVTESVVRKEQSAKTPSPRVGTPSDPTLAPQVSDAKGPSKLPSQKNVDAVQVAASGPSWTGRSAGVGETAWRERCLGRQWDPVCLLGPVGGVQFQATPHRAQGARTLGLHSYDCKTSPYDGWCPVYSLEAVHLPLPETVSPLSVSSSGSDRTPPTPTHTRTAPPRSRRRTQTSEPLWLLCAGRHFVHCTGPD